MTTKYTGAIIFTKHTDLMPWFDAKYPYMTDEYKRSVGFNQFKRDCERLRDVQLILLYRYERGADNANHTLCKVKCPINPLPIKGEFEVVSLRHIVKYLQQEGWQIKTDLPTSLLK